MADPQRLEQTGFLDSMIAACSRGINVTIVTDKATTLNIMILRSEKEKQQNFKSGAGETECAGYCYKAGKPCS